MSQRWEVLAEGFGRLEGPSVDGEGNLYFADLDPPLGLFRLGIDGKLECLLEGRVRVGGTVPHADGGVVITGPDLAWWRDGLLQPLFAPEQCFGFNDLTTDAHGRVVAGMFGEAPSLHPSGALGSLWTIELDGTASRQHEGVSLPNGMAFAPGDEALYYVDTGRRMVCIADLADDGSVASSRPFFELDDGLHPDGIAVDEAGNVLVAPLTSGDVLVVGSDGELRSVIETPRNSVSSVCFGGADRRDLYVVTFGPPYDLEHTGAVLRTRVDVPGVLVPPARVRPSAVNSVGAAPSDR